MEPRRWEQIRERMAMLRAEHPDEDNWIGYVMHDRGECIECDALRELEAEQEDADG